MRMSSKSGFQGLEAGSARQRVTSPYNSKVGIPHEKSLRSRCSSRGSNKESTGAKRLDSMRKSNTLKHKKPPSVGHNILEVDGRTSKDLDKIKVKYSELQNSNNALTSQQPRVLYTADDDQTVRTLPNAHDEPSNEANSLHDTNSIGAPLSQNQDTLDDSRTVQTNAIGK
jgi:hypothetical protein